LTGILDETPCQPDSSQICLTAIFSRLLSQSPLSDLYVHHNRTGIGVSGVNNTIFDNTIQSNTQNGIYLFQEATSLPNNGVYFRNRINSNGQNGILIDEGSNNVFYNNLIYGNTLSGVNLVDSGVSTQQFYYNYQA